MKLNDQDRLEMQRKTVSEHLRAECEHDYERVNNTFVQGPRAYYEIVPGAAHFDGIEGVAGFYELLNKVLPDLDINVTHEYDLPGISIRELTAYGTHSFEFAGVPASGNKVAFEVCALYIFDESEPDRLLAERAYWDNDSLIRQLKGDKVPTLGLVEKPRR